MKKYKIIQSEYHGTLENKLEDFCNNNKVLNIHYSIGMIEKSFDLYLVYSALIEYEDKH